MWYSRSATDAAGGSYNRHFQMRATSHWGSQTGDGDAETACAMQAIHWITARGLDLQVTRNGTVLVEELQWIEYKWT